jgi:AraC-like DNA-binding protein
VVDVIALHTLPRHGRGGFAWTPESFAALPSPGCYRILLRMDALSQALGAVRSTGAIFSVVECTSPWGFSVPPVNAAAHLLGPGTERLVNYHLVTDGEARIVLEGAEVVIAGPGDVVVLPHGTPHTVTRGSPTSLVESAVPLAEVLSGRPRTVRFGGGGPVTRIVCGFFGCERHAERLFLAGLPRIFKVNVRSDAAGVWLERSILHLVEESASPRPGTAILLAKMAEAMFIETLRRYIGTIPEGQTGWLAGARDPVVGGALALLHRTPDRPWTVSALAADVGASRSVLGERFARFLGEPPLAYLARWRLQLAARCLEATDKPVLAVALDVGYRSEPAFNRAFKRQFGVPPARYRKACRSSSEGEVRAARISRGRAARGDA